MDVLNVKTEYEDFGWPWSPLFDGGEKRAKGTKQKRTKEWKKKGVIQREADSGSS